MTFVTNTISSDFCEKLEVICWQDACDTVMRPISVPPDSQTADNLTDPTNDVNRKMVVSKAAVTCAEDQLETGEFNFKKDVLNQLGDYFKIIRRLKSQDEDSFGLYSKIGAYLLPPNACVDEPEKTSPRATPWFRETLPTFGAVTFLSVPEPEDDGVEIPKFFYFTKFKVAPWYFERASGVTYKVTCYYDKGRTWEFEGHTIKRGVPLSFGIAVQPDGRVLLLKHISQKYQTINHKKGNDRSSLCRSVWGYPDWLADSKEKRKSVGEFMFAIFARYYELSATSSVIRISASKSGMTAVFGIDVRRTPRFFHDREPSYTEWGNKRRIFHIRRAHRRNGKWIGITFAGQRSFSWNGYNILITVPGRDHANLAFADFGAYDEKDCKLDRKKMIDPIETGKRLANYIRDSLEHKGIAFR